MGMLDFLRGHVPTIEADTEIVPMNFINQLKSDVSAIKGKVETWEEPVHKEIASVLERLVGLFEAGVKVAAPIVEEKVLSEAEKVVEYGTEKL